LRDIVESCLRPLSKDCCGGAGTAAGTAAGSSDFAGFLGTKKKRPLKSMRGLWKDLNISLSEEDIAEARKEMWGNFPREHFFERVRS